VAALAAAAGPERAAQPPASPAPSTPALVYERIRDGNQDLYVSPAGGGAERRLTGHPATDGLPRWRPDGGGVYFTSDRTGNWQIYEVGADGGEARRVRANAFTEWQADPSPDGRRLAFLSNQGGAEELWILDLASGAARSLLRHGRRTILGNPDFDLRGRAIVFSSNWRVGHQIHLVEADTGRQRRVSALSQGGCEPRFHPDGLRVVYVSRGHLSRRSRLVEHDLASGRETVLVGWPALNYDPAYSPDGSELAFASDIAGEYAIYRQDLRTGRAWRVTHGPGPARYPDYRPR
jgi:Tol biopolymer transport system component